MVSQGTFEPKWVSMRKGFAEVKVIGIDEGV